MSHSKEARFTVINQANRSGSPIPTCLLDPSWRQRRWAARKKQVRRIIQQPAPETVPITPPRQIRRPNFRLLIDSPIPRADTLADPRVRARFVNTNSPTRLRTPATRTRTPSQQTQTLPVTPDAFKTSILSDPSLIVVNGIQTRKRRAQDTEIELVAAENGITNTTDPIVTVHESETVPTEEPGQQAHNSNRMLGIVSSAKSVTRMIASIYSAVANIGETISKLIRPQAYRIAEFRSYVGENQVLNKRVKLSASQDGTESEEVAQGDILCWIDRNGLTALIEDYQNFCKALHIVWHCLRQETRAEANKDLGPLNTTIVDNVEDRLRMCSGEGYDLFEVFGLQLKRVFQYLGDIYEISLIVKIRNNNDFVPPVLDLQIPPHSIDQLVSIKNFLSGPALLTVCKNILQKHEVDDVHVSQAFVDQIVLDIKAIIRNLPAPSYVDSPGYRGRLQAMFPTPPRTDLDLDLLLPGSFPVFDEPKEPVEQLIEEPEAEISEEVIEIITPPPESPRPVVSRPSFRKTDFLRVDMAQMSIERITPEDYRQTFYEESEEHRVIKNKYITDFEPKAPLTSNEVGSLRSILRNRRKHPSRTTPKRLGITRRPKAVRFAEDTTSPRQRTHLGLDVPKQIRYNATTGQPLAPTEDFQEPRPRWAHAWLNIPPPPAEPHRDIMFRTPYHRPEKKDGVDPTTRINEILALPSLKDLVISDDSRAGIEFQKEQAAQKAAEEARLAAEEARLAAEAAQREEEEKARKELEERLARSGGLRIPNQTFVAPVSPEWHRKALDTLRAAGTTSLAKSAEGVDLRKHDFTKVVIANEWLNDEIVNASLVWLDRAINQAAGIKDVKRNTRKILAMGSFFWKRLQEQGVHSTQRTLRRYGVEKRNFLDIDIILLPICEHSHWTLLAVRPSKRTVAHLDSINARGNSSYTSRAMAWIKDILEEKFIKDEWKVLTHEAPLQNNGHDCGVHTITNAMCLSLGLSPIDSYTAQDMPTQRIRIACMLLNGGFKGDFDLRVY
ncbi:hypothetical protein F66182_8228 [Fusarium sp. NRRL 66182]|nr:hypothetical protein F66182_8228 [Fusarium sp. NRRL 66182]